MRSWFLRALCALILSIAAPTAAMAAKYLAAESGFEPREISVCATEVDYWKTEGDCATETWYVATVERGDTLASACMQALGGSAKEAWTQCVVPFRARWCEANGIPQGGCNSRFDSEMSRLHPTVFTDGTVTGGDLFLLPPSQEVKEVLATHAAEQAPGQAATEVVELADTTEVARLERELAEEQAAARAAEAEVDRLREEITRVRELREELQKARETRAAAEAEAARLRQEIREEIRIALHIAELGATPVALVTSPSEEVGLVDTQTEGQALTLTLPDAPSTAPLAPIVSDGEEVQATTPAAHLTPPERPTILASLAEAMPHPDKVFWVVVGLLIGLLVWGLVTIGQRWKARN